MFLGPGAPQRWRSRRSYLPMLSLPPPSEPTPEGWECEAAHEGVTQKTPVEVLCRLHRSEPTHRRVMGDALIPRPSRRALYVSDAILGAGCKWGAKPDC